MIGTLGNPHMETTRSSELIDVIIWTQTLADSKEPVPCCDDEGNNAPFMRGRQSGVERRNDWKRFQAV